MIAVSLKQTYPEVLAGLMTVEEATLGTWASISEDAIKIYGDVLIGIYNNVVVSAFDINGHHRTEDSKVVFEGEPSAEFAVMVSQKSPAKPWVRGQARPVQYLDTDVVRHGDAPVEMVENYMRAVVGGYVLTVDQYGIATVQPPVGGVVTVTAAGDSGQVAVTR